MGSEQPSASACKIGPILQAANDGYEPKADNLWLSKYNVLRKNPLGSLLRLSELETLDKNQIGIGYLFPNYACLAVGIRFIEVSCGIDAFKFNDDGQTFCGTFPMIWGWVPNKHFAIVGLYSSP